MQKVFVKDGKPIKLWLDDIEEGALNQAINMSNLPFLFKHVAIMPDAHQGYGMPIGGVMATQDVVIPNAVGVDIGCGMCAVKTNLRMINQNKLHKIVDGIKKVVPLGFRHHNLPQDYNLLPDGNETSEFLQGLMGASLRQIGTLGGGNHFIEIQSDDDDYVWIMLHSGSRNVGFKVAKHYNDIAIALNAKWFSSIPRKYELAFLPIRSDEGKAYLNDMEYCVEFAEASRALMMKNIQKVFVDLVKDVAFHHPLNKAHNYAQYENHFGKNVMVHRKGATSARDGEVGIIPGSQGTASYIVMGKGN